MNKQQVKTLYVYAGILIVMLLFPPTTRTTTDWDSLANGMVTRSGSGGFQFIGSFSNGSVVNIAQLVLQLVIISLAAAALWLAFKGADKK